ncbi:MAG: HK97 family phage prohead protease [Pseudomonadota bacterium]
MDDTTGLEHKFARFSERLEVRDGCQISGYASLFGDVDQGNDVVAPGAYAASLSDLAANGGKVKMLWQHNPSEPIGIWDEVREDAKGLYVKGRLLDAVAKGREAKALIEAGAIDGLSIGYRTRKSTRNSEGQRLLKELELWEVSLVTFPMLPNARITGKSDETDADRSLRKMAAAFRGACADLARR